MYHHINSDKYSNSLEIFESHLEYLVKNYNIVVPGDKLKGNDVCLTFDDAFFDFYYYVFPLFKKYKIKVILAVPSDYILESSSIDALKRLDVSHDDTYDKKESFCTYEELQEMVDSTYLIIASHSSSHCNLQKSNNLESEIINSKKILEKRLNIKVDSFIYPFGKYNDEVVSMVNKHYKYSFRIGNAIHKDFTGINGLIYRVNADSLINDDNIFSFSSMLKYRFKAMIKRIKD